MKNLKKAIAVVLTISCMFATLSISSVAAESQKNAPQQTLKQYLSALKKQDAKRAAALSVDQRVKGDIQEIQVLNQRFQDPNLTIESYDLLDKDVYTSDNEVTLVSKIEYINKRIEETPVKMKKSNNDWYVSIDGDMPNPELYKLVNEGTVISNNKIVTASALTTWNEDIEFDETPTFYTSNFNVEQSKVTINERQFAAFNTPTLQYAIVTWGYFSDTVWASGNKTENNPNSGTQFSLYCNPHNGVCLRVTWTNVTNGYTVTSYGEVYDG